MRYRVERQGLASDAPIAVVDMYNHWCGGHVVIKAFGQDVVGAQEYADVLNTIDDESPSKYPNRKHEKYVEDAYADYFGR